MHIDYKYKVVLIICLFPSLIFNNAVLMLLLLSLSQSLLIVVVVLLVDVVEGIPVAVAIYHPIY